MLPAQIMNELYRRAQIHKIMAGLLDQYLHLGSDLALQMAHEEGLYFLRCCLQGLCIPVAGVSGPQHHQAES